MKNKLFNKKMIAILFVILMLFSSSALIFDSSVQSSSHSPSSPSFPNIPATSSDSSSNLLNSSLSSSGSNLTAYMVSNNIAGAGSDPNNISLARTVYYQNISATELNFHMHIHGDKNCSDGYIRIHYDSDIYNFSTIPVVQGCHWYNTTITLPKSIPSGNFESSSEFFLQFPATPSGRGPDSNFCIKSGNVKIYAISPRPTITISTPQDAYDAEQNAKFLANISGSISSYEWYSNQTLISNESSLSYAFPASGDYSITEVVQSDTGWVIHSNTINITVSPKLCFSTSSSANPGDVDQEIVFSTGVSGGTGTYTAYDFYLYHNTSLLDSGDSPSFDYTFSDPGAYLLKYSVEDSNHNTILKELNETINSDPKVSIVSSQNPTDKGLPVEFRPVITGGTGPFSFAWSYGGNTYASRDLNLSFSSSGTHTISLEITDENGYSASATFSETVNELPSVLAYSNVSSVDTNIEVHFTSITSNGTPPDSFMWFENGSVVSHDQNFSMEFASPGTYTLQVEIFDSLNVSSSDNVTIIVNPNPVVTISVPVSRTDANVTETFTSVISGGTGPYTFEWFQNNILVNTSSSFIFNSSSPGTFNISLIIKDSDGRVADSNILSEVVVSDPTIYLTYSHSPVVGESVTICTHISGGVGDFSLQWTFQSGSASGRNVTYSFSVAGNRSISIALEDGSGYKTTQHFTVTVRLRIEISESIKSGPAPLSVSFSGEAIGGSSYLYAWNFGDGNTSDSQSASNTFSPGNYTVLLSVTDSSGITGSASVEIRSYPAPVKFEYTNNENITQVFHFVAIPNWDVKGPYNASWTMPNGQVLYGMNISYVFPIYSSSNTIYITITYNSTSLYGGDSYSTSIIVHMKPANIKVIFTPPSYIPPGTMLDMNASASAPDTTSFTFAWLINGASYSGNNTDYYFASAGKYYVNLTVTDSLGATTSISRNITVQSTGSASSIKISISTKTVGSYYYYTITVDSVKNISNVEAFLSSTMLPIKEISGNNTHQIYNLTLNQRNYNSGTFTITIIAYNVDGGSNSQTTDFSVTSKYSSSSSLNIVQFFGGIGNTLEIIVSLTSIIAGYLYFRKRGTTVIQEPGGYEEVGRPGKPLILEKKGKK